MKCLICRHGETEKGTVTVTLEREGSTLVFKNVAAEVCANCGEAYLDEAATAALLRAADQAARQGVQVAVRTLADGEHLAMIRGGEVRLSPKVELLACATPVC